MYQLKDIPMFSSLQEKRIEKLQSDMIIHNYGKDSVVFYEGDSSDYLYILLEGTVRLYKTAPKGTQVHMHNFVAPEVIALFAVFEEIPFPATCEFLDEGVIGLIPMKAIREYAHDVDFSMSIIASLSKRMNLVSDLFHKEIIYSAEAKIADILYNNPSIFQRLKNSEIAAMINMTAETLSRVLSRLKKEEIISISHRVVTILNKDALKHVIESNTIRY